MLTIKTYTVITDDGSIRVHETCRDMFFLGIRILRLTTETRRCGSDVPAELRRVVFAMDVNECVYCEKPGEAIDHIIPRAQQGTSLIFNLATACRSCNSTKGGRTPSEAGMPLRYGRFRTNPPGWWFSSARAGPSPLLDWGRTGDASDKISSIPMALDCFTDAEQRFEVYQGKYPKVKGVYSLWLEHVREYEYGEPFNSAFIACNGRIPFLYSQGAFA